MNKKKVFAVAIVLMLIVLIRGMLAYFTDKKEVTNTFTLGNVKITITEPNYDTTEAAKLAPNKIITKDPTITNVGTNDAYLFARVEIPYYSVTSRGENTAANTELFSLLKADGSQGPNTGWTQVSRTEDTTNHKVTYVYAYTGSTAATMETVATNESAVLFNKVKFANLTDYSELTESSSDAIIETFDVKVEAYAIQKDLANDSGTQITAPDAVWSLVQENY